MTRNGVKKHSKRLSAAAIIPVFAIVRALFAFILALRFSNIVFSEILFELYFGKTVYFILTMSEIIRQF
jgi:hypothetical protein